MNVTSIITMLNPELTRRLAAALVHSTWQGTAGAVVLAILLRAMRNRSASARYVAACAMLAVVFGAAVVTFVVTGTRHRAMATGFSEAMPAMGAAKLGDVVGIADGGAPVSPSMVHFAVAAWVAGVGLLSLWQVAGWWWLQMIRRSGQPTELDAEMEELRRRMGIERNVRVLEAQRVESPAVMGVWRPVVLIPVGFMAGLAPAQVEAILAHELAHVRRGDYLANLVQSLIETLLFYHPCVWWISAQIRLEREHCCDDIAADIAGDRVGYAETLVMLEGRRGPKLAMGAGGGELARRVRRLVGAPSPRRVRRRSAMVGILTSACVLAVVMNRVAPAQTEKVVKAVAAATTNAANSILPEDLVAEPHDYLIGANDLVQIAITDLVGPGVETVKSMRVTEKSGEVSMPLVGAVHISGLTAAQAEHTISAAYEKASLIHHAQVSVQVSEQRGNTFSILGSMGHSGEYAIAKTDFRVLDALVLGGISVTPQLDSITILRKQDQGARRRIDIPIAPLAAGDLRLNVVIRPGDLLMATEPEKRFLKVIVDRDALFVRESDHGKTWDKKVDWSSVEDRIRALTPAERRATVLEIGVANRDLSVGTLMDAQAVAHDLVAKYSLSYLSDVGVQALHKTDPETGGGIYYIGGHVQRVGVYILSPKAKVTVRQAIIAAGMQDEQGLWVSVHRGGGDHPTVGVEAPLDDKLSDPKLDAAVEADDSIMVGAPVKPK